VTPRLAKAITYIFHPLFLPTLTLVVLYFFAPLSLQPLGSRLVLPVFGVVFLTTTVIPGISMLFFQYTGRIADLNIQNRRQRIMPFLFISMFYAVAAYGFYHRLNQIFFVIMATLSFVILLLTLLNLSIKISAHVTGIAGVVGILLAVGIKFPGSALPIPLAVFSVIGGIVAAARLSLEAHDVREIVWGAVLGFGVCFSSLMIFLQ